MSNLITFIVFTFLFLIQTAQAYQAQLEQVCNEASRPMVDNPGVSVMNPPILRKDQEMVFVSRRTMDSEKNVWGIQRLDSDLSEWLYLSSEKIQDFVIQDNRIWVLLSQHLIEIDHDGVELMKYSIADSQGGTARALTYANKTLYIAHASSGVVAFDLEERTILWRTYLAKVFRDGNRSFSTSVSVLGEKLYISMTGATVKGFNGIIEASAVTGEVLAFNEFNRQRAGVIDDRAQIEVHQDRLVLNNGGWIHVVNQSALRSRREIVPRWIAVAIGGNDYRHYMMWVGRTFTDGNQLKGCGLEIRPVGNRFERFSRYFEVEI